MCQRYLIKLTYNGKDKWTVTGYWGHYVGSANRPVWDLDGAPKDFNSRKEALEFCLTCTGVPE